MFRTHARGMRNDARSGSCTNEPSSSSYISFHCHRSPLNSSSLIMRRVAHCVGATLNGTCALMDQSWSYGALDIRALAKQELSKRLLQSNELQMVQVSG